MLQAADNETEILLGNKQLLGIFVVVVVLLGIAFGGGYMLGREKAAKTASTALATPAATDTSGAASGDQTPGQTRTVTPGDSPVADQSSDAQAAASGAAAPPLGSRKHKPAEETVRQGGDAVSEFMPASGQTFLQVAAVARGEASGIADVLRKKGFRAHAVPVPGSAKMYRVLVGPIQDAGDLSATRDKLRDSGFAKVFVQHY